MRSAVALCVFFFFFNDTATTEIYTLSLHDALPIWPSASGASSRRCGPPLGRAPPRSEEHTSELQSANISYAVFCLKKKTRIDCRCYAQLRDSVDGQATCRRLPR